MPPNNQNSPDPNSNHRPRRVVVPGGGNLPVIDPSKFFLPDYPATPATQPVSPPAPQPPAPEVAVPAPQAPKHAKSRTGKHRWPILPVMVAVLFLAAMAIFFRLRDKNQPPATPAAGIDIANLSNGQSPDETFLTDITNANNPNMTNNGAAGMTPPTQPPPATPTPTSPPPATILPPASSPSPTPSPAPAPTPTPTPPPPTPPPAGGLLGNNTIGTQSDRPGTNYKFGTAFLASSNFTATKFSFYARGGARNQGFKPVIYNADGSGNPTSLLTTGSQIYIAANSAAHWETITIPSTAITSGKYYVLALMSGSASASANIYYSPASNAGVWNSNNYSAPSNPWGTINREDRRWSYYIN